MPLIRPGITGFFGRDDPAPRVDVHAFKRDLFEAARAVGATVLTLAAAGPATSYHAARVRVREDELRVLCHATFPFVAFTRSATGDGPLRFEDRQDLGDALQVLGYEVAGAAELAAPLTADDWVRLGAADIEQARYWKPETVGELAFNTFD